MVEWGGRTLRVVGGELTDRKDSTMKAPAPNAAAASNEAVVRSIPLRRKVLFVFAIWLVLFLVAEIGARVGGYLIYDRSPFFLFYGIKSFMADADPQGHSAAYDGYFKFPPSRTLKQYGLFTEPTPIQINSHGFRGVEFSTQKPDSVTRVICLGESSTFGFYDRDEGTYPAILDRLLNDSSKASRRRYEVINAGIPHVNSDNIRAMVEHEILTYRPDVLTFYAGYNDAIELMAPSRLFRALTWIHGHFASYVAFKTLITKLGGPALPSRWSVQVSGSDSSRVNQQVRLHVQRYRANVDRILELAAARGVRVIFVRQALTTTWGEKSGLTYRQKVDSAQRTISAGRRIDSHQTTMIVHSALMSVLDSLAMERGVPVVDYITVADRHPEYFASYVHLTEEGNRALADLLEPVVEASGGR
jgi:lysophospholipase L1-like esterase